MMTNTRLLAIRQERINKLKKLRKLGIDPYPAKYNKKHTCGQIKDLLGKKIKTAGRIMAMRGHGKISFYDLQDQFGQVQIWFQQDKLSKKYKILKLLDIGDFIGVEGEVIKTKSGEITIDVKDFTLLSKAIRPLPEKWHGLKDTESRYRQRYLDLLLNPEVRKKFDIRSKLIRSIQDYLDNLGYVEVETATLQPLYGGSNARPFETHLNALDMDMYLRIADELYLKRLVVGGYERVYEICKDFRNEGMDLSHNPEFTMIEFYEAYADYHRIMEITEGLFKSAVKKIFGREKLTIHGKKVDLSGAWPKIKMVDVIKRELSLEVEDASQQDLVKFARKNKVEIEGNESKGALIYKIFDRLVPSKLIEPVWVIDYPVEVCPLQKLHPDNPGWAQRFEGYIGGEEICDGWSEINNPLEQRKRFEADQDKEEAHPVDEDFLKAMEYGMPTLGGIGIGIDRLTMFFTDTWSIKEVILFPLLKPKGKSNDKTR